MRMRLGLLLIGFTALVAMAISGTPTAFAEDDSESYVPVYGRGEHRGWDERIRDFGSTYSYYSGPTDDGWYTNVAVAGPYALLLFGCTYSEGNAYLYIQLRFHNLPAVNAEKIPVTVELGAREPLTYEWNRWSSSDSTSHGLSLGVSTLARSRASDHARVTVGPFTFDYTFKGLFDLPVAQNIIWCDDQRG